MKKFLMTIVWAVMAFAPAFAQNFNDKADNIVGEYLTDRGGSKSKVRVTKNAQGTYDAQVFWVEKPLDDKGQKRKDVKNPDKGLRNVDIDKVVLVKGLKYDAEDKCWGGAKIYDPTKGDVYKVVINFQDEKTLRVRGFLGPFSKSLYWHKIEE